MASDQITWRQNPQCDFDNEGDTYNEELSVFSRAEAGEIEQDFYEDDSDFEDLVADEDPAPTEANVDKIQRSSNDSSEMSHLEL